VIATDSLLEEGLCSKTLSTRGVSQCWSWGIYIKKYLKAKEEELWKLKYFIIAKI
jgi:hypothetical protein